MPDAVTLEGKGERSRRRSLKLQLEGHVVDEYVLDPPGPRVCRLVAA